MAPQIDPKWHARIVHATLDFGGVELTGVDILPPNFQRPQGFFVTVTFDDPDEARRVFTTLADGGDTRTTTTLCRTPESTASIRDMNTAGSHVEKCDLRQYRAPTAAAIDGDANL
jgi:uncharacterized glyoxalase superfamily protein PhnB